MNIYKIQFSHHAPKDKPDCLLNFKIMKTTYNGRILFTAILFLTLVTLIASIFRLLNLK